VLKADLEEQRLANVMASPQLTSRQPRAGAGPRGLT
jgi:hypothetical protein